MYLSGNLSAITRIDFTQIVLKPKLRIYFRDLNAKYIIG